MILHFGDLYSNFLGYVYLLAGLFVFAFALSSSQLLRAPQSAFISFYSFFLLLNSLAIFIQTKFYVKYILSAGFISIFIALTFVVEVLYKYDTIKRKYVRNLFYFILFFNILLIFLDLFILPGIYFLGVKKVDGIYRLYFSENGKLIAAFDLFFLLVSLFCIIRHSENAKTKAYIIYSILFIVVFVSFSLEIASGFGLFSLGVLGEILSFLAFLAYVFTFLKRSNGAKGALVASFVYMFFHINLAFITQLFFYRLSGIYVSLGLIAISYVFLALSFKLLFLVIDNLASYERRILIAKYENFSKNLVVLKKTEELIELGVSFLRESFNIEDISIVVYDEENGVFVCRYPEDKQDIKFPIYEPFLIWLSEAEEYVCRNSKEISGNLLSGDVRKSAKEYFDTVGADCCIPVSMNETLIAAINFRFAKGYRNFSRIQLRILHRFINDFTISMSNALLYERLVKLNETLEDKVEERSKELEIAYKRLLQSEKLASLGTLVAGIAHEVNTPSGVIKGAIENIRTKFPPHLKTIYRLYMLGYSTRRILSLHFCLIKNRELYIKGPYPSFREMLILQKRIKRVLKERYGFEGDFLEKLTELLSEEHLYRSIIGFASLFKEAEDRQRELLYKLLDGAWSLIKNIENIDSAIRSISKLINALRVYTRVNKTDVKKVNIHDTIENVLALLHNKLKYGIDVRKVYDKDLPEIECIPEEISQVFSNIILNAVQAMKGNGKLVIKTSRYGIDNIKIDFIDNGPGIPEEIREKIFDPFFTTKDQGEGTGLGLSISKEIVEKHRGTIKVTSRKGYTCFSIILPIKSHVERDLNKQKSIYKFS